MKKVLILVFIQFLFACSLSAQDSTFQLIKRMIDSVSTENLTKQIKVLEDAGGHRSRVNFTPGNDSAANYIIKTFNSIPNLNSVKIDTFFITSAVSPYDTKPLFNIEATITGKKYPQTIFVVGAHYDASASRMGSTIWQQQWKTLKAPGADDNATGVAALFEMARILTDTSNHFQSDFTIKFVAFGAEESGPAYSGAHHGSVAYAKKCKQSNQNIIGMVSIDMIGYNKNHLYQAIVSNGNSLPLANQFYDANTLFDIGLTLNSSPFVNATYSDHASFWDEGYRAILLIENAPPWNNNSYYTANPYYHTSSDSFGTLNMTLVKKVTQWNLGLVAAIGTRLTDTEKEEPISPNDFVLYQNYPNPFNPSTTIKWQSSISGFTSLKVFDIMGGEVVTLVSGDYPAGIYDIRLNASNLSSGVYYYQLKVGNNIQTKKMMIMK